MIPSAAPSTSNYARDTIPSAVKCLKFSVPPRLCGRCCFAVDPWAETTRTVTKYRSMKLR